MWNLFVLLTVLFVALKLFGIEALWIPFALVLGLIVMVGVFLGFVAVVLWLAER